MESKILTTRVRWNIKQTVRKMMLNKLNPTIQFGNGSTDFKIYCSYIPKNFNTNEKLKLFYEELVCCVDTYPEKYIYIIGYYNFKQYEQYISELFLVHNPTGATIFEEELDYL